MECTTRMRNEERIALNVKLRGVKNLLAADIERASVGVEQQAERHGRSSIRGRGFTEGVVLDASWPTVTIYPASTRAQYASMVRFHAGRARHRSRYDAILG